MREQEKKVDDYDNPLLTLKYPSPYGEMLTTKQIRSRAGMAIPPYKNLRYQIEISKLASIMG